MTATFQIVRDLGWDYLEKLSKQRVMQVQSSTDPPKKLALGERAIMADGNDYNVVMLKEAGQPVEPLYPAEGTPTISGPTAIFASCAASQCRAAVSGLAAYARNPAVLHRFHRAIFGAPASDAEGGPPQTLRHQADEGGRGRRREDGRRDQDTLCAAVSGLVLASWRGCLPPLKKGRSSRSDGRGSIRATCCSDPLPDPPLSGGGSAVAHAAEIEIESR